MLIGNRAMQAMQEDVRSDCPVPLEVAELQRFMDSASLPGLDLMVLMSIAGLH